jgi:hypothetical protein
MKSFSGIWHGPHTMTANKEKIAASQQKVKEIIIRMKNSRRFAAARWEQRMLMG